MNDSVPVLVRLTKASLSNIEPVFPGSLLPVSVQWVAWSGGSKKELSDG